MVVKVFYGWKAPFGYVLRVDKGVSMGVVETQHEISREDTKQRPEQSPAHVRRGYLGDEWFDIGNLYIALWQLNTDYSASQILVVDAVLIWICFGIKIAAFLLIHFAVQNTAFFKT